MYAHVMYSRLASDLNLVLLNTVCPIVLVRMLHMFVYEDGHLQIRKATHVVRESPHS